MADAWYNYPEAAQILANLTPDDVEIGVSSDGNRLVWHVRDDLDRRLEKARVISVNNLVGYSLDKPKLSLKEQDKWFDVEEAQASISDRVLLKFGDPMLLAGYGPDIANKMWKKDSMVIRRMAQKQRKIADFQDQLAAAGRL